MRYREILEACWKGYHREGNKKMFGKTYPNCVKNTNEEQGVAEGSLNEFAAGGGGGSGNYFQELASAWYNGTYNTGSLQKGIKTNQDIERLLQRGIVAPDGKTRKYNIDYNSDFDGVIIFSDDYYEHSDYDDNGKEVDSRTGRPWGPYDHMEFKDEELDEGVAEGVPQPGESSGKAKQFNPNAKVQTREMTLDQILNSVKGIPYVNNVVDDWDAKDYSWGVTKKVIEYAQYLQKNPQSVANLPPLVVIDGQLNDGAHRLSAINLLQKRMDPKNPLWKQVKLKVNFGTSADVASEQGVAEGKRVARKPGQPANSKKHSDLYTDENPRGTITGLKFATVEDARASVSKIRNSGRSHAHKIQAAVAMEQRARAAGKASAAAVYRRYINANKRADEQQLDEKCWDGYSQQGVKKKGDRMVPNCVSMSEHELEEDLKKWFKQKWVRFGPDGKIRGPCARGSSKEGKPKCLPQSKAYALGKKKRAAAGAKKRREDPNAERRGPAKNVATRVRENEVKDLEKVLQNPTSYDAIDHMMQSIAKKSGITAKALHDRFVKKHSITPDEWIKNKGNQS